MRAKIERSIDHLRHKLQRVRLLLRACCVWYCCVSVLCFSFCVKICERSTNMSKSVPDRWLQYKPYGEVIKGTKILAFKVPLKERVSEKLHPEQQFTTASLLEAFPQLKFIVDLTNTYRYYDKTEFTDGGLRYEKIMVPGMQVPPFELVKKYFKMMDDFTSTCGEDDLIGIHCTHGVNRTGYFICRYLIQQLGWEYQDALTAFEEARGYPIERETYVNDLKLIPKGEKIDTSNVSLVPPVIPVVRKVPVRSMLKGLPLKHLSKRLVSYPPMGPSGFVRPHSIRGFANGGPFPKPFGFRAPGFGPMLPMPPIPPPPPPPGPMYGPRPVRYGPPPMRPPMPPPPPPPPPPPHPGFQNPGFPPRMPGLHRMAGPPRLHPGPPRLPLPKMLPPPPPVIKRLQAHKEKHMRNGVIMAPSRSSVLVVAREKRLRTISRPAKDQDFTIDTFEENLITALPPQRRNRGRFSQSK